MDLKKVLEEEKKLIGIEKNSLERIKKESENIIGLLKGEIARGKVNAEVFLGGSFAKGTLVRKDKYDIDIFVRFDWRLDEISNILEGIVKRICRGRKINAKMTHGSRDYFRVEKGKIIFEIIPVYDIKNPKEARNVTDLSYFHVNYVKKRLKNGLVNEVLLAKQFCASCRVYGAESYIQGFSGYGLECLIIYYKSFEKMLKELVKVKERIILDPEKLFRKKEDVLFSINESKLQSPIILVDPTWKERNVLAALSWETFKRFQDTAMAFLKKPSREFFIIKKIDVDNLKKLAVKKKGEFLHLVIRTDRQEGDIAGTKMKKFARLLENELAKYFEIYASEFEYSDRRESDFCLVAKKKREVIKLGPPVKMVQNVLEFKKRNKNFFEKNEYLHAKIKVDFSAEEFLNKWKKENSRKVKEMGISGFEIAMK